MSLKTKQITVFTLLLSLSLLAFVVPAEAAGIIPAPTGKGGDYSLNDFIVLFINISKWILGIVGSLTLLMFIYGGITMIFSAGNSETVSRGKQIILNSIMGLVIVFTSYIIIQFAGSALLPGEQNILEIGWF